MRLPDVKAAFAEQSELAASLTMDDLEEHRGPGNVSMWVLGRGCTFMPSLVGDPPAVYVDIMRRRAWANLSGNCPDCGAPVGVDTAQRVTMSHANRCLVGHPPRRMGEHIDPSSLALVEAFQRGMRRG